jgi:Tol biopolymer transport system component
MFIANSDMTESRKIATLPNRVYWPRFSPDGMRIRFTQYLDQFAYNLWELRLDGSEPYRLLRDWQGKSLCCGSWTPDGKYYVFQARADESTQLWAIENADDGGIDSSEPFQITSGAIDFLRPTISADGKTIFAVGWQLRGEILEYENATGKFSPAPGLESMSVEQASYSRDHQSVAYISYPDGTLWHKKINESESQQLTYEPMQAAQPVWSPDGSKIAFTGWLPGEPYKIYIAPANGGDPSLISDGDSDSWSPSWSSDGARLVFSDAANDQLQVYDLKLATTANMPGTSGARSPTWSFDGKSIAARSGTDLINYDVNSQTSTVLLENVRYNFKYWSGNSDALYLVDSFLVGRERSVYRLNIEDKKLSKIAVVGTLRNTWGTVGQWIGVSPDGKPLLLRDQSIHNIYALRWESD